jgi:hypothetical protein
MERLGMTRLWADFRLQDHHNSRHGPEASNRHVVVKAYRSLGLSFNSPIPEGDLPQVPQNALDVDFFSRGWDGAFRPEGKTWL